MKSILTCLIILTCVSMSLATVINVPADSTTIQAGINGAATGDTILVASGTYYENLNYNGKDVVVTSVGGPSLTVIDGSSNGTVVLMMNGESSAAVLDGFTIQNGSGFANSATTKFGGGITIRFGSSPRLSNLLVTNNTALGPESSGGGIGVSTASESVIENVIITNNEAYHGGGLFSYQASPTLKNVTISNNSTTGGSGGGAGFEGGSPTIEHMFVYDNITTAGGGGLWFHNQCQATLNAVTIFGNRCGSGWEGGGLFMTSKSSIYLLNSICRDNSPDQIGSYVTSVYPASTIGISYSNVEGGENGLTLPSGELTLWENNIDLDPEFIAVDLKDFRLTAISPCIDAGIASYVVGSEILLDLSADEYAGLAPDMGAYEYSNVVLNVPSEYTTIQTAIDGAEDRDIVLVSAGTYVENINFNGKNIVVTSVDGPEQTIIDGNQNGSTVLISSGENATAILDGFTITNGNGTVNSDGYYMGGGIYCRENSRPTLRNLIIENNIAIGDTAMGGGIMCSVGADATIEDVIIRNNEADYGGGFVAYEANPTLKRIEVYGNHARTTGGGLTFWTSASLVEEALVYDNTAYFMAAGIWAHLGATPMLNRVTVTGNRCTTPSLTSRSAGGLGVSSGSNTTISSSIFWDNIPSEIEYYYLTEPNHVTILYSDIEGGTRFGIVTNDNGTLTWGLGNISTDPLFCDPDDNLFTVVSSSPCVGSGEDAVDMGALGVGCTIVTTEKDLSLPSKFALNQNYPNPFNPSTTLSYDLADEGWVSLVIYDLLGRQVSTLINREQVAGYHSVNWHAVNDQGIPLGAGIYLYQLKFIDRNGSEFRDVKKFSLLK